MPNIQEKARMPARTVPDIERDPQWSDIYPYMLPCVVGFSQLFGYYVLDNLLFPIWFLYVILPLLEMRMPHDLANVSPKKEKVFERDWRFLVPLYA